MNDLRSELQRNLQGRIAWLGIGNRDYGDDAFGLALAEALIQAGVQDVYPVGTQPERWIAQTDKEPFDQIVFLDAVELSEAPGSVVFLDAAGLTSRFPQISTHKISLGTLAALVESEGSAKTWLLGAQPATLQEARPPQTNIEHPTLNTQLRRNGILPIPCSELNVECSMFAADGSGSPGRERLTALRPGHRPSPTLAGFKTSDPRPLSPPLEKTLQLLVSLIQEATGKLEPSALVANNGIEA